MSGGRDGQIIVHSFDDNTKNIKFHQKHHLSNIVADEVSVFPQAKSVCEHPKSGNILVGTRGGEIVEFSAEGGKHGQGTGQVLHRSHHDQELWGLAPRPDGHEFLTVGREGLLAVWDSEEKRQTRYAKLECGADAVAYSENIVDYNLDEHGNQKKDVHLEKKKFNKGRLLAVGMRNGYLLVVFADEQLAPVAKIQHSKNGQAIKVIRFSPDDKWCAVGGEDGSIKVYDVRSRFKKAMTIRMRSRATSEVCGI